MDKKASFDSEILESKALEEGKKKGDELISLLMSTTIKKKFEEDCEEEYK